MNIVILMAGKQSVVNQDVDYPLYLSEVQGRTILERQIDICLPLQPNEIIFCVHADHIKKFSIDNVVKQCINNARCISVIGDTAGSVCTALLASEWIDTDEELLLIAVDDFIEKNLIDIVDHFRQKKHDAGTVTFHSVHPRYSYVAIDANGCVEEVAEKRPISRNAVASVYYFKEGSTFVACAKSVIRKDSRVSGRFYISQVLNHIILQQKSVGIHKIPNSSFHPLKSEMQLAQYVMDLKERQESK